MFNAEIAGLAVAGLLFTGAAQAFPGAADDAGVRLPAQATHVETNRGMPGDALTAFPGSHDDAGIRLQARMTRADAERGRITESLRAGAQAARPTSTWTD